MNPSQYNDQQHTDNTTTAEDDTITKVIHRLARRLSNLKVVVMDWKETDTFTSFQKMIIMRSDGLGERLDVIEDVEWSRRVSGSRLA